MYWQEVPYRAVSVLRGVAQSKGYFAADRVPPQASDAKVGRTWIAVPSEPSIAEDIRTAADKVLAGDLSVFGHAVPFHDGVPRWNADPVTGTEIGLDFGLSIDFRHVGAGVDIKFLWEVNRHLWWVPLAQQYALSGERRYLDGLRKLLASWLDACPYARGPNWSSPVEHGIRLINWSVIWHLVGGDASPMFDGDSGSRLRSRWLDSIYQHIRFARDNYSFYSSADNHLIGEAAGVFVGALTWDRWAEVRRLRAEAKAVLERETQLQFCVDGVNLEQALCYHKFSLQFLLASGLCARANGEDFSSAFWARIESATTFLASVMDCEGHVPAFGDSDDGEVWRLASSPDFNSYRSIVAIGAALFDRADLRAKVQACGSLADPQLPWLAGLSAAGASDVAALRDLPTRFERGGYVVFGHALHAPDEFRVTIDCGPLGYNRISGHGHADALSVQISCAGVPMLVDPGTYCYNAAPDYRHFFRGTHAHNTLVVDGEDQSEYGASFLWLRDVTTTVHRDGAPGGQALHASHDGYRRLPDPVTHHRRVTLEEDALVVEDWLECAQPHDVELLWHAAAGARIVQQASAQWTLEAQGQGLEMSVTGPSFDAFVVEGRESPPQGWASKKFYQRSPAPVLSVCTRLAPGQVLKTLIRRRGASAGGRA